MYGLIAQVGKFAIIGIIYYFLYNFLKIMVVDLLMDKQHPGETGYCLLDEDGREYPLFPVNTVGRASDSDIVIEDPFLSSKHALITKRGRNMLIQDLNSTNGTFVNGKKIKKPFKLRENDEVVLGDRKFKFLRRENRGIKNGGHL
ncbi:MAG: FHA domain-containing protein [Tepidanaerobacteraceae bacterium]|jgi:predicted component of type VI protein secretion system|nr:FHA domain-containing protein [Tepidanaerobacteraceae bacterium]